MEQQELIEKIKRLPQDRIADVEAFVDSLIKTLKHNATKQQIL